MVWSSDGAGGNVFFFTQYSRGIHFRTPIGRA